MDYTTNHRTVTIKVSRGQVLKMAILAAMMANAPHQFEKTAQEWSSIHDKITDAVRELDQKIEKERSCK